MTVYVRCSIADNYNKVGMGKRRKKVIGDLIECSKVDDLVASSSAKSTVFAVIQVPPQFKST